MGRLRTHSCWLKVVSPHYSKQAQTTSTNLKCSRLDLKKKRKKKKKKASIWKEVGTNVKCLYSGVHQWCCPTCRSSMLPEGWVTKNCPLGWKSCFQRSVLIQSKFLVCNSGSVGSLIKCCGLDDLFNGVQKPQVVSHLLSGSGYFTSTKQLMACRFMSFKEAGRMVMWLLHSLVVSFVCSLYAKLTARFYRMHPRYWQLILVVKSSSKQAPKKRWKHHFEGLKKGFQISTATQVRTQTYLLWLISQVPH